MNLTPGTRLGPYQIIAPLGAGGMGEVYRAKDTRLDREVAVKVLPQHLSANSEVRARFEREAKTVSSLNHPHICTLFDVGREGDTDYLVMELIEGETLAARLTKGALSVGETLRIGSEIADALDRAHRAGVVHRDLKPGNIMLTRSGAKLMDFGLARVTGMAGPGSGSGVTMATLTQSPTRAQPLTAEGTIVGTFQYMSPEQLEGKETDARSDLWAFGCVLYEMATGRRAFEGRSQASLIGAIMHAEPAPISQVAPMTPPELDRLVRACLVKDPDDRVQSAHDLKLQLKWIADGAAPLSGVAAAPPAPAAPARKRTWLPAGIAAATLVAATALVMALVLRGGPSKPAPEDPERYIFGSAVLTPNSSPVLSPDGRTVVFSARDGAVQRLYRRDLSSLTISAIAGTEDGAAPCFSPDGAWIAFVTSNDIRKVPVAGGVGQVVLGGMRANSVVWGDDGMIYYTPFSGADEVTALGRVAAAGGRPEVVAPLDTTTHEVEAWLPDILPGGKGVILTVHGGTSWNVDAVRPDGSRITLVQNAICARYVEPGYLVYADMSSAAVLAVPFDAARMEVTGSAVPVTEPVDLGYCYGVSGERTMVYVPAAGAGGGREVVWLSRDGSSTEIFDSPGEWAQPRVSPDGNRILLRKIGADCELWVYDIERASLAKVVQGGDNHDPIWAPDGRHIAYDQSNAGGKMVSVAIDGARDVAVIPSASTLGRPRSWSAVGNRLVFEVTGRRSKSDIWTVDMDGSSAPAPFLETEFDERDPSISPDGNWIAYVTDESGTPEVFLRPCPPTGDAWRVSIGGGASPLWSRDGRELYFVQGMKMMALAVETHPAIKFGKPVQLFEGGFDISRAHNFDVARDGRFVAVRSPDGEAGQREMRVLLNWPAEMRRVAGPSH